ncbi:HAD family hydrolase [Dyella solisilvae]|uniref:HAD family hydrolase n=1 Tax=Dyella solisilvae TaxID=1920168 RepID=A0A370K3Z2_9GAMM|nr:HAD family hydrolase [Dyella solisilvae]RDI97147.1 HAD family hydrolase [Dyella solisilvae]
MNLALFDFDGTITTREMFRPFLEFAASRRRRLVGGLALAPMVAGYKLGLVSANLMRASAVRLGLAGRRATDAQEQGRRFAQDILPGVLREQALERIHWHKSQGDRVVVVSGALDVYLSHWCRQHGLELLCSELEVRGGRFTGRYRGAQCVRDEKPRRVHAAYDVATYPVVYAYGDTPEDFDLLRIAHRRYYRWQEVS